MNRNRLLTLAILLAAAGIVAFTIIRTRAPGEPSRESGKSVPVIQTPVVAGVPNAATNQSGQAGNAVIPAEKLPTGWQDFRTLTEQERLDRVTAAMENHTLPADLLAFFEKELFNRQHWDVTRNNMANALVWPESPNPRLHERFAQMLADESESPVWCDYCLQFLSK
jgi:hypothetical protein